VRTTVVATALVMLVIVTASAAIQEE